MAVIIGGENTQAAADDDGQSPWSQVPWRTIVATVAIVCATAAGIGLVYTASKIVLLIVVAGFFAIVLAPAVRIVQRRVGGRRTLATSIVMFSSATIVIGLILLFLLPVRNQLSQAISDLPGTVDAAANGKGPFGEIVSRLNLQDLVRNHQQDLEHWARGVTNSSLSIAREVVTAVVLVVTLFVITFLFITQSQAMATATIDLVPVKRRTMIKRLAGDSAHAISGYMLGNVVVSIFAGVAALVILVVLRVPNPIVLALFVAFADMIPLVGATIGATFAVLGAFLHSPTAGVIAIVFFILYQQFENSVLQTMVMARTVKVNPVVVIVSVLLGVELLGFLGALLAIPVAGSIQVVARELWHERNRDRFQVVEDDFAST